MADNQDDSFNASKAEVFEALGHPTRIRLLQTLSEKPLPFSELKRAAGLESNGLLTFHLGKLSGLVRLNPEGVYALTDEGREALRIVGAIKDEGAGGKATRGFSVPRLRQRSLLTLLVVGLLVVGAVAVYQQQEIAGLDSNLAAQRALTPNLGCGFYGSPPYIIGLIQQVEGNSGFLTAGHNLVYVFEYYSEGGATTGTANGKPYYSPPSTSLAFYSFGKASPGCEGEYILNRSVVGALWVQVPKNPDGSYNFTGMSVYFTPGLFINQTASSGS